MADVNRGNEILVRFDLDLDGILTVTATEKATGREEQLTIDNAMSRFRSDGREAAKARLNATFAEAEMAAVGSPQAPDTKPDEDLLPEVKQAVGRANELLTRAERLLHDASEQDAEEMRTLMAQLRLATEARAQDDIQDISGKLDDLVFYLQDAP